MTAEMNIEYTLIRSQTRTRSTTIAIKDGEVVVRAPQRLPLSTIERFIEEKLDWIREVLAQDVGKSLPKKQFVNGELLPYLGELVPLEVKEMQRARPYVMKKEDRFLLLLPIAWKVKNRREILRKLMEDWYIKRGRIFIAERVAVFAQQLGVKFGHVRLKRVTTRWGSCSSEGNLNFNWKLMLGPQEILDYVVVHEVCHIVHHHHQRSFWELVATLDKDYRRHRRWLKYQGWKLNI